MDALVLCPNRGLQGFADGASMSAARHASKDETEADLKRWTLAVDLTAERAG